MGGLQFFCTSVDQPEALNFNSNFDMNTTVNRLRPFSGHWTLSVLISWLIVLHHIQNMASYGIILHRIEGRRGAPGEMRRSHECQERSFRGGDKQFKQTKKPVNNFNTSNFHQFLRECKHCSHIMPYHHIHMPHMYHSTGS